MKRGLAKALLLLVAVAVSLAVGEQLLRLVGFEYRPMSIAVADRADTRVQHLFEDEHFVYDPRLIWRPRRDYEVFNEQGFRGPVLGADKPAGEFRVFALGDSNTLGWAGPEGANWPLTLGERMRARNDGIRLVNAGVWGYSSYQGRERLEEVLTFDPDMVLISFGSNDAHLVLRSDGEFARQSLLAGESARWLLRFRLVQLAAAVWDRVGGGSGEPRHRVSLEEYRENLRQMVARAREHGAVPVFLTRPYTGPVNDPGWWKSFGHLYNRATVEVGEELRVPVIDLYSFFKRQPAAFSDESHFNRPGHRRAAQIVFMHLRPLLPPRQAPPGSGRAAAGRLPRTRR